MSPNPPLPVNAKPARIDSAIGLKSVGSLMTGPDGKAANYLIRSYQRGYRWTPLQVTQLLDDIWSFAQEPESGRRAQFYCLQPLVVKKCADGGIEVVDGQQRLTTIYIILTFLKPIAPMVVGNLFHLTFETRSGSERPSLDSIDLDRKMENIDYYHICQAYLAVQNWCESLTATQQLKLLQHIMNDDVSGRNVKVIWFELGGEENAVDAFTRLNVGKIPLTNDELVRALFLGGKPHALDPDESLKVQIAYEWDLIEKELQAPDFWAFLTDQKREQNRIGFLFELIADADGIPATAQNDDYKVFYSFSAKLDVKDSPGLKSEQDRRAAQVRRSRDEWLKIKKEFMRLQEWFEDERRITYHIIGFLVTQGVALREIRQLSEACTKSEFERRLRARVYQCVMGVSVVPPEADLRAKLAEKLEELSYGRHSNQIRSILLLFNIATLLENEGSNLRFQFDAFKNRDGGWDLEHIQAVASAKIPDRPGWLVDCRSFLLTQDGDQAKSLVGEIGKFLASERTAAADDEEFERLRSSIVGCLGGLEGEDEGNGISNLTLLDSRTNRSYKNAHFPVKRQKILDQDKAGVFIPLCTRNVFLKAYTKHVGNPVSWTAPDGEAYQDAVLETLVGFFLGKGRVL